MKKKLIKLMKDATNEGRLVKIFAVVVIVALAIKGISILKKSPVTAEENPFPYGMEVQDENEYWESQKDVPSDIEGMSVYDKHAMGLRREEGSDTDRDGLTDKEEIEVYKTDPLKASTSGDLYTDKYKIENGMDVFSSYQYEGTVDFKLNQCPEVKLEASVAEDLKATVWDVTGKYSLEYYNINTIYKGYYVHDYEGIIKIDTTDIQKSTGKAMEDMSIVVTYGPYIIYGLDEPETIKYSEYGNIVTLEYDFLREANYLIFFTEKQETLVGSIYNRFFGKYDAAKSNDTPEEGKGMIYGFPVVEQLLGFGGHIDYVECDTNLHTNILMGTLVDLANNHVMGSKMVAGDHNKVKPISEVTLTMKTTLLKTFLPNCEFKPGQKEEIQHYFFLYSTYDQIISDKVLYEDDGRTETVSTGFDKYVDELPFQNFSSYISEVGNCAGITHLSSYLYNKKTLPTSGSYECTIDGKKQLISWELSSDDENTTLYDAGLIDYKTESFVDDNSTKGSNFIGGNLSDGEEEFVNMIGCFWAEGNDRVNTREYELNCGTEYDVSLIRTMMQQLDKGKVLDLYLYMKYGGAHAVNVYGYEYVNDSEVNFLIYDNNLPQDSRPGFVVDNLTDYCMLQVTLHQDENGNGTFEYLYWPMTSNMEYFASSRLGTMRKGDMTHAMIIMDENWTVLN